MKQRQFARGYAFWGLVVILSMLFVVLWPQPVGVEGQIRQSPSDQERIYALYYPMVPLGQAPSTSSREPTSTPVRTFRPTPTVSVKQPPPVVDPRAQAAPGSP
jgi:hypothetical protein